MVEVPGLLTMATLIRSCLAAADLVSAIIAGTVLAWGIIVLAMEDTEGMDTPTTIARQVLAMVVTAIITIP